MRIQHFSVDTTGEGQNQIRVERVNVIGFQWISGTRIHRKVID